MSPEPVGKAVLFPGSLLFWKPVVGLDKKTEFLKTFIPGKLPMGAVFCGKGIDEPTELPFLFRGQFSHTFWAAGGAFVQTP